MSHLKQIFLTVILVVIAELLLKTGVRTASFSKDNILQFFIAAFSNPIVILGFFLIGISSLIWITTLSKTDLSYAYPFVSAGYIATAVLSVLLLNEPHSILKWFGLSVIGIGVFLMSRS